MLQSLNLDIFYFFYNLGQKFPHKGLLEIIANKIDNFVVVLAMLALGVLLVRSVKRGQIKSTFLRLKEAIRVVTSILISWGLTYVIKQITMVPRPYLALSDVTPLFLYGGYDSFPSGHATLFMALGVMMSLHHKRIGYLFIFLAVVISIARIMVGIHFPVDILFGFIIGGGVSLLIYKNVLHR